MTAAHPDAQPRWPTPPPPPPPLRQPRRRRRLAALVVGLIAIAVVILVASAYLLLSARNRLESGVAALHRAQTHLSVQEAQGSPQAAVAAARSSVVAANADFRSAQKRIDLIAPILQHLGWLPVLGSEAAAVPDATHAAVQTTDGAVSLLDGVQPAVAQVALDRKQHRHVGPSVLVHLLAGARPRFNQACADLAAAKVSRARIPGSGTGSLAAALRTFDRDLPRLTDLCQTLQILPSMLGYPSPKVYMVVNADPLELRAQGGYMGSFSLVTLRSGNARQRFSSTTFGEKGSNATYIPDPHQPLGAHDDLRIPPPEPVQLYNHEAAWLFRDSNWPANFPTAAQVEEYIWRADGGRPVDGVINVTPAATADLLRATGPIYLKDFHVNVTANNLLTLTDHYTHVPNAVVNAQGPGVYGPHAYSDLDTRRKQFIGAVSRQLLARLRQLQPATLLRLGSALSTAFAHRDLELYFQDPAAERLARRIHASGEISRTTGDYLYVVDSNLSYNKISLFIHRSTTYDVTIRPDRWLDVRLRVNIYNQPAPPADRFQGWWGPCGGECGSWDDYATFLRIFTPAGAQLVDQTGWDQAWSPGPAYGKTMFSGYLRVKPGQTRTVYLHYVVPPNVFSATSGHVYHLLVQAQPGAHPDRFGLRVHWESGTRSRTIANPRSDWKVSIPIPNRPVHPVPLPRQTPVAVRAGTWVEPHAFLSAP